MTLARNVGVKLILAFAAVCLAFVVGGSLFIAGFVFETVESQIIVEIRARQTHFPNADRPESIFANVTVFNQDGGPSEDPSKPYIVSSGLTAKDDRASVPYSLQVSGRINNTDGGTAYNAFLKVKATNAQGVTIVRIIRLGE